jgi:hypothetical protein
MLVLRGASTTATATAPGSAASKRDGSHEGAGGQGGLRGVVVYRGVSDSADAVREPSRFERYYFGFPRADSLAYAEPPPPAVDVLHPTEPAAATGDSPSATAQIYTDNKPPRPAQQRPQQRRQQQRRHHAQELHAISRRKQQQQGLARVIRVSSSQPSPSGSRPAAAAAASSVSSPRSPSSPRTAAERQRQQLLYARLAEPVLRPARHPEARPALHEDWSAQSISRSTRAGKATAKGFITWI